MSRLLARVDVRLLVERFAAPLQWGAALVGFGLLLWFVPRWQVASIGGLKPVEQFQRENEARDVLAKLLGGALLIVGAYYTGRNATITREGQITGRFNDAIAHLGDKESLAKRLGGIYSLERIARDSPRDHWPIVEILTAFVREAPPPDLEHEAEEGSMFVPGADVEAIIIVLGRRTRLYERPGQRLNLRRVNVRMANLSGMHLEGADFGSSHLDQTKMEAAFLQDANFRLASMEFAGLSRAYAQRARFVTAALTGADVQEAELEQADFTQANLKGAKFQKAQMRLAILLNAFLGNASLMGADLEGADLRGARLLGTDLSAARLPYANLEGAQFTESTRWPPDVDPAARGARLVPDPDRSSGA